MTVEARETRKKEKEEESQKDCVSYTYTIITII